jgi:hypothetical protein
MRFKAAILFLLLLPLCRNSMAHPGNSPAAAAYRTAAQERSGAYPVPLFASSRKQASRLLLEARHRDLRIRLDSLWNDTLRVKPEELPRYRRALRTADQVMAEAESRLLELKSLDPAAETRKWESLRARTERTLFGLDRYLADAEGYWLPVQEIAPPPATENGEDS